MSLVRFENVEKIYGETRVLSALNFQLFPGELVSLLGPNGAGKSTALQILLGLKAPTRGQVYVSDKPAGSLAAKQMTGATLQDLQFPGALSVQEILNFSARIFRQQTSKVKSLIHDLDLESLLKKKASVLSGGESRKLGLAVALMGDPKLLVLDEPTTGLDLEAKQILWQVLRKLRQKGTTILLTSHDLHEIESLTDRVLVLSSGKLIFEGDLLQIQNYVGLQRIKFEVISEFSIENAPSAIQIEINQQFYCVSTRDSLGWLEFLMSQRQKIQSIRVLDANLEEALSALLRGTSV